MKRDEDQGKDEMMEASRMSWRDHFVDLRHSIVYSVAGFLVCFFTSFYFFEPLYQIITQPLYDTLTRLNLEKALKFRTVQGAFFFHLKIAFLTGLVFSMPICTYQAWRFIAPGLYKKERMIGISLVMMTTIFFACGVLFGYFLIMPFSFDYLLGYTMTMPDGSKLLPDITLEDYAGTFTKLILASGITFQTPVFIGFLAYIGLVTHHQLIAGWRWATVFSFILAAILTPPDYITQVLLAIPLMFFYALSILIAWYITRTQSSKS